MIRTPRAIRSILSGPGIRRHANFAGRCDRLRRAYAGWMFGCVLVLAGLVSAAGAGGATGGPESATSDAPLSDPTALIDSLIESGWQAASVRPSGPCDDAAFVRRVSLDLIGRVPTDAEQAQFLADGRPDKRERWVDQLLESPEYARHMADLFDALLLGRERPDRMARRNESGWREYLEESFAANRPWNRMARDMVLARATEETDVRAGWFLFERRDAHQEIAEAIAPAFFGIRIECAQCHDHPLASEIEQQHYWGLVAFFSRSKNERTDRGPRVAEAASGGTKQFTDLAGNAHPAELTFFASTVVQEPEPAASEEATVEPNETDGENAEPSAESDAAYLTLDPAEPRVPKTSRRELFADLILADHPLLARSFVNRMWALLVGRGFVHPHDRMDSTHPASHPELLDALAADFRASGYDIKRLVRHIVRSRAYQLDSLPADEQALPEHFAYGLVKPLTAEALLRSMQVVLQGELNELPEGLLNAFRAAFADVLPEEPIANLSQALLLTNHPELNRWVSADASPTIAQLAARPTVDEQVDGAFRAALGREPEADERDRSIEFVQSYSDPSEALGQLMWALLTSTEFRLNH